MANKFFGALKEGMKEGINDIVNGESEEVIQERKQKKLEKQQQKNETNINNSKSEVSNLLGTTEEILYAYSFWNDKMIVTDKKLIYVDKRVAKNKTFAIIPYNKITSYSLLVPTGLSTKGKLKIFTGGDNPALEIETSLNEGMNEFCKILADII